ncbi:hypothetical protein [Neptunicoccus cionae]|uniref:Uncharacterized protein n=1 Tax=Neptunicoccus cionae TaxID=2035344 RepID=A0A916VP26_9RHOB|nr:hypothetical protein [Amylibacter cionae]GGA15207.1 hypothetical protein GCM10011498_14400 [Amylibacter cionae]
MARKVGFSKPDTEAKRSIADSYLDEFRQRHNHELSPDPYGAKQERKRNWFVIVFLTLWLTGWSGGILLVSAILRDGNGDSFLYIWLAAAVLGWGVAVYVLIQQLKGRPLSKGKHD